MSPEQRRKLNAMCGDISAQVPWRVKVRGVEFETYLHKDDWRHMWAGIQIGSRIVPNPEEPDKMIELAASSKLLTDEEASILIERLYAFGSDRGVKWTDPEERAAMAAYERAIP